jgi:hypothetical protein
MDSGGGCAEHSFAIDVVFLIALGRRRTPNRHSALRRNGDERHPTESQSS